ncbi:MAG: dihydroneopterin aldolase [Spirochaetales bacterium]
MAPFDELRLENWAIQVAIGAWDEEKAATQQLVLDVRLRGDFSRATATDRLDEALDYAVLRQDCERWLLGKRWVLLEAFTADLCQHLLTPDLVREVTATVLKPAAQAPVRVSCTMTRAK